MLSLSLISPGSTGFVIGTIPEDWLLGTNDFVHKIHLKIGEKNLKKNVESRVFIDQFNFQKKNVHEILHHCAKSKAKQFVGKRGCEPKKTSKMKRKDPLSGEKTENKDKSIQ